MSKDTKDINSVIIKFLDYFEIVFIVGTHIILVLFLLILAWFFQITPTHILEVYDNYLKDYFAMLLFVAGFFGSFYALIKLYVKFLRKGFTKVVIQPLIEYIEKE